MQGVGESLWAMTLPLHVIHQFHHFFPLHCFFRPPISPPDLLSSAQLLLSPPRFGNGDVCMPFFSQATGEVYHAAPAKCSRLVATVVRYRSTSAVYVGNSFGGFQVVY